MIVNGRVQVEKSEAATIHGKGSAMVTKASVVSRSLKFRMVALS